MRALLLSWGSRGDIEPLAALALQLRELGAEVRMCAPPDEEFAALLDRVGVTLIPLGPSTRSIVTAKVRPSPFELAAELVAARFEVLPVAAEGCDVMVATGLMPAGARSVADKLGIRYVLTAFHLYSLPSRHFRPGMRPGKPSSPDETDLAVLWKEDAERVNVMYGEPENRLRAEIGLPPIANTRDYAFTDRPFLAADPILCPSDGMTDLDLVQTGAWILPDDRPLPDDLEAFLAAGDPPVYAGFGSAAMSVSPDLGPVVIEAIRAQGRRVLLGRGWANLSLIDDADDCFAVGEINQQALFRRAAAVVHHGGAGTTHTAAVAGVPQAVVPQFADQNYWAGRVADLGIGTAHGGPYPTVESLSATLGAALRPETSDRARTVAATIRTDGAAVAAKLLLTG